MFKRINMTKEVQDRLGSTVVYGCRLELSAKGAEDSSGFAKEWSAIHSKWRGKSKAEVAAEPLISAYSRFYGSIGLDPKKTPPSVQNMLQRFFIKKELEKLPLIHPIVDAVNVAALRHLIPLGVFDAECVRGEMVLSFTRGGELFQGLGASEPELLPAGQLVLADEEKTLSRYCYRDSEAQKVTAGTRSVWLLGCQVPGVTQEEVESALQTAKELLERMYHCEAAGMPAGTGQS